MNMTMFRSGKFKFQKAAPMQRKKPEEEFQKMMNQRYHLYTKKARDAGYVSCPQCGGLVRYCPHCNQDMLLPKAGTYPDYIVATTFLYVECKQGPDSWSIKDFTPTQMKVMDEHLGKHGQAYLFLEIGEGRAPDGRHAFLVEWAWWRKTQEGLLQDKMTSIRFEATQRSRMPIACELLKDWQLAWRDGGWAIPKAHPFWQDVLNRLDTVATNIGNLTI